MKRSLLQRLRRASVNAEPASTSTTTAEESSADRTHSTTQHDVTVTSPDEVSTARNSGFQHAGVAFLRSASAVDDDELERANAMATKGRRAGRPLNSGSIFSEVPKKAFAPDRIDSASEKAARVRPGQLASSVQREDEGHSSSPATKNPDSTDEKIAFNLVQIVPDTQKIESLTVTIPRSAQNATGQPVGRSDSPSERPEFLLGDTPLAREISDLARRRAALAATTPPLPLATRVFTVANQKGGVGKTTSAVNLSAALARSGARVLVIDLDPQGNASTALGVEHRAETPSVYDVIIGGEPMASVVQVSPFYPSLFCVPATIHLAGAEIELVSLVAREQRLRTALEVFLRDSDDPYHYVFIDCPPSLGLLTINAFVSAGEVLIPIQCEYYALEGLSQLMGNIALIEKHLNPALKVSTILLTMFDSRTNLANQVAQEVREHFPQEVLDTLIPRSVRISEAPSYGQTVISYDTHSAGSLSYQEAAAEIARRGAPN